jgi:4,5-dihydroxyphthalate decarboxylase
MNLTVLRRPRTQALLDGRIALPGVPIQWLATSEPLGWGLGEHEKHRDLRSGYIDGGEMSIASFVQAKAQGAPLVALPIFLKRGLVQRSLLCAVDSPLTSPERLAGQRVGLVSYASSMAVWMRGILADEYGLLPQSICWTALSPGENGIAIPGDFSAAAVRAWEELDGYPHELDRRESFLLSLLERKELHAVVSFQTKIASGKLRPVLTENDWWRHYRKRGVYPINHLFVLRQQVVKEHPALAGSLLSLFCESRRVWADYLPEAERTAIESEMRQLGWDPYAYRFGDVERASLEAFVEYLSRERVIARKPGMEEMFIL